ncbi:hypothetical protein KP79_PYT06859 [Mizuhopecten yessoensis]|uniref:Uncharacterized protein n=1 Tax=Mizuhopecten yessoensis TaxID=6573 RepID=A0A210QUP3_MIZYE|nr:hypothetical protein KP79_PYT06859 [Mizuhopecten yessoensis]
MVHPAARRFQRSEPKSEFEIKAIALTSVCFFYAIAIFLTVGFVSKASSSIRMSVSSILKRFQLWDNELPTKLNQKPTRSRWTKYFYQG